MHHPKYQFKQLDVGELVVWIVPCLVHQVRSPRFIVIQVLLELVVHRARIVLQKEDKT